MGRTLNFLSILEQNLLRTMFLGSRLSSGGAAVPSNISSNQIPCEYILILVTAKDYCIMSFARFETFSTESFLLIDISIAFLA